MSTQAQFSLRGRNPDVLSCIANLSNDEVFTPPELANHMLDMVAEAWAANNSGANIWEDSSVRFLDPFTKSGIFLREITSRLTSGLASKIPNLEERINHILKRQVYGIAITHLTSLLARRSVYCSKNANGQHSIAKGFDGEAGNIWFEQLKHTWVNAKCTFCGASQGTLDRGAGLETHAYPFIHTNNIKTRISEFFGGDMQFDVIIGNPPYQLASDGGTRDVPIYHHFVEQAKMLEPRYLVMIIPSRWMTAGLGLNEFRKTMLNDQRIRTLIDYPVAKEVFSSVEVKGGVCYFLWDAAHSGDCEVTISRDGVSVGPTKRNLSDYDVFVRDVRAISILNKVLAKDERSIMSILSADKEFGWTSNFNQFHDTRERGDIPLHYARNGKRYIGYIHRNKVVKSAGLIDTWKVLVPKAGSGAITVPDYVLGTPIIAPSPSVCTQTFLFFYVNSLSEAESVRSYLGSRFLRFLVSLRKITQDATKSTYTWVPMQSWDRIWTDAELYAKYGIITEEQEYIESQIKPVSWGEGSDNEQAH
ncbi:Eco57I restriction-modification methylase domain-containing protein [Herpetosiphon giganteus]|uniref:Eco57I restriction-modification methylase domain-containing protein n=1 Tax=Herpetosiphon giganteus TaxID=2029754 RepID=UPI0019569456|nr:Eco57I restriction-modification methylase domain-containing protein [Herpetosiphon giganteus]MBM7846260.1 site-specific DNA-methyltransferase (adenine-specific) [Herpetosiphon giganteus]